MKSISRNALTECTRDRLITAAVNEIHNKGFEKTRVEAITKAAKVSYRTFYIYFKNKSDLLVQVYKNLVLPFSDHVEDPKAWIKNKNLDAFEKPLLHYFVHTHPSSKLIRAFAQGASQNREILNLFLEELKKTASFFLIRAKSLKRRGLFLGSDENVLSDILATSIIMPYYLMKMGVLHADPGEMAKVVSYFIFTALNCNIKLADNGVKRSLELNQTGKKILAAAKIEFSEKGYLNAGISHIAKKAGCSRAIFYNHFKNKDDLLQYLYRDFISPLNLMGETSDGIFNEAFGHPNENNIDSFIKMSGTVYDIFDTMGPLKWAFLQGIYYSDRLSEGIRELYDKLGQPLVSRIEQFKAKGKFPNKDSALAADIIFTTIVYMAFMITTGMIDCSRNEFSITMGKVLYGFFNFKA